MKILKKVLWNILVLVIQQFCNSEDPVILRYSKIPPPQEAKLDNIIGVGQASEKLSKIRVLRDFVGGLIAFYSMHLCNGTKDAVFKKA